MPQYSAEAKREAVGMYEMGLSCRAVAEHLRVRGQPSPRPMTVLRWAKAAGKGRRTRGHRLPLSGDSVRVLYDHGMDVGEIAHRLHVGTSTIYQRLHEAEAEMRPSRIRYGHVLAEGHLRLLYVKKDLRARDIAVKFGCNIGTVYNWLRKNDIPLKRHRQKP